MEDTRVDTCKYLRVEWRGCYATYPIPHYLIISPRTIRPHPTLSHPTRHHPTPPHTMPSTELPLQAARHAVPCAEELARCPLSRAQLE